MRLFLALELPPEVRERMAALVERLRAELPGWRWVDAGGGHLTLRFLGEVPEQALEAQIEAWRQAVAKGVPFRFAVRGLGVFPSPSRPRVLWAGVTDVVPAGALEALAAELEAAAQRLGFPAEARPFRPHLTLARAARGARPRAPRPGVPADLGTVEATAVTLFRSHLSPAGARYTALAHLPIGGAGVAA